MKYFKIIYKNGDFKIEKAKSGLELIKKHGLYTKEHVSTRIFELSGEQEAIARSNEQY
jgi:hypothetical protein